MHLNPHAKCLSSRFNLKVFKKKKNGGHLNSGNTIVIDIISFHYRLISLLFVQICIDFTAKYKIN